MAIIFDFYQSPSKKDLVDVTPKNFHARVVNGQSLDTDYLIQKISKRCTLTKSDIQSVISEITEEVASCLLNGDSIHINGIGRFSLSLQAPKDANPGTTHAQNIQVKRIEFRADKQLKNKVINEAVFERSRNKVHSAQITNHDIDTLLINYFKHHAFITRKQFEELCHFTRNTAQRHLHRLINEGKLVNSNTQHNPTYEPTEGFNNKA